MSKFSVRETANGDDVYDVFDTGTGEVVIINETWLGAIPLEEAGDAADLLNVIHAKRDGLLN